MNSNFGAGNLQVHWTQVPRLLLKCFFHLAADMANKHPHLKAILIGLLNYTPWLKNYIGSFLSAKSNIVIPIVLSERAQEIYKDIKIAMVRKL